jgi:signal peptidase II
MKNAWSEFLLWMKNKNYEWRFKLFIMTPIIIVLLVIDWTTKSWAVHHLLLNQNTKFMPGFLRFGYVINQGSAYGAMADNPGLVIALASIITIVCLTLFLVSSNRMIITTFAIIFGGSFGNLLGRAWSPDGNGVVDFLIWDFKGADGYIFNMADLFVNIGIGFAILTVILYVVEVLIAFNRRKHSLDAYEEITELKQEIEINRTKIESMFWKNSYHKWKLAANIKYAEIGELKAQIRVIKAKLSGEKQIKRAEKKNSK